MNKYNQRILKIIGDKCEKEGYTHNVGNEYYENFLTIPEGSMETLIRTIVCDRVNDINRNILSNKWKTDEEIHDFIIFFLEMIALGHIVIRESDKSLIFSKAVGSPPDSDMEARIDAKIKNSIPIMDKVILSALPEESINDNRP